MIDFSSDKPPDGPKVYGYARASTKIQELSIESQTLAIETRAKLGDIKGTWAGVYGDPATSGKTEFALRKEAAKLLEVLKPGDHLIVVRMDRLGRNMFDVIRTLESLCARDVAIHIIQYAGGQALELNSAMGKILAALLAGFAELHRQMIADATRDAHAHRRAAGLPTNQSCPYGTKLEKTSSGTVLVPDKYEQDIIKTALMLNRKGVPYNEIAKRFAEKGLKTKGWAWSERRLARAVRWYVAQTKAGVVPW